MASAILPFIIPVPIVMKPGSPADSSPPFLSAIRPQNVKNRWVSTSMAAPVLLSMKTG